MVGYDHRPLLPRQLHHLGAHGPVGLNDAAALGAPIHIGACVDGVFEDIHDSRMSELAPAQLAVPHAAIGPLGKEAILERDHHLKG